MGNLHEARRGMDAGLKLWEKLGNRYRMAIGLGFRGWLSMLEGDWESARDFIERGLSLAPQDTVILGLGASLEFETGETYLERMLDIVRVSSTDPAPEQGLIAVCLAVAARISGVVERLDIAEEAAGAVLSSHFATPFEAKWARDTLALIAVQRADAETAAEHYGALESQQGMILHGLATGRLLGLLAHTIGKPDEAVAHFEDALAFCRRAGYRPELAWSLCDYADAQLSPQGMGAGLKPARTSSARNDHFPSGRVAGHLNRAGHAPPLRAGGRFTGTGRLPAGQGPRISGRPDSA